jgi:phage-related protein
VIIRELITLLGFKLEDSQQKKYDKQIDATKEKSNALAAAGKGIGTAYKVAAAAVAIGIGWISKNILDATLEMEGYRSELEMLTGGADEAAETLARLRDNTVDPLFGTGNLVNAYKQLRTVGMEAQNAENMIGVLGDVANGSVENFNALSTVLSKTAATGKFSTMQLNMLAQAGFGIDDMAQGLGKTVPQLKAEIDAGKIGFNELAKAMEGATQEGGKFYQNAEKHARTFGGAIKILQDVISSTGDAIGTEVLPGLIDMIRYITQIIKAGNEGLVAMGVKAFQAILNGIADTIIWFQVLQMRIKALGVSFGAMKGIVQDVIGFVRSIFGSIMPFLINLAGFIMAAFEPIRSFVRPILKALEPVIHDVFEYASQIVAFLIPLVQRLTPVFQVLGNVVGFVASVFTNGGLAIIKALMPLAGIILAIVGAIKIWTAIQWLLNVAMTANPIGLIILAIVALIGVIALLVKNIDKVKAFFIAVGTAIANFFKKVVQFIKDNALKIVTIIGLIFFTIPTLIALVVALIIKHWDKIKAVIVKIVKAVVDQVKKIWEKLIAIVGVIAEKVKTIWSGIMDFFRGLMETIKSIWEGIWNRALSFVGGIIESIKSVWSGIVGFFSGLWESIQEGPTAVIEYIKNAFFGLFDNIKEKFFGFIGVIQEGWEKVKGFFGGIGEGVVNFFTGGQGKEDGPAMGAAPGGLQYAAAAATAGTTSNYNSVGGTSVNSNANINVNVPAGTSQEQALAISRQVDRAVQDSLGSAINSGRGTIPSPEARRN